MVKGLGSWLLCVCVLMCVIQAATGVGRLGREGSIDIGGRAIRVLRLLRVLVGCAERGRWPSLPRASLP